MNDTAFAFSHDCCGAAQAVYYVMMAFHSLSESLCLKLKALARRLLASLVDSPAGGAEIGGCTVPYHRFLYGPNMSGRHAELR